MIRKTAPAILAALWLAACARSEEASLAPPDENALREVETVRTPERDDEEIALGDWRDSLQDDRPALEFGPQGAPPLFSLRCDERRGINLQRHGAALVGDLPMMLVSIGSETRRLAVTTAGGSIPMLRATIASNDQLSPVLAQATSPIAIRIGDSPPLILPPSPKIGLFITRCSTGEAPPRGSAAAATDEAAPAANEAAPTPPES